MLKKKYYYPVKLATVNITVEEPIFNISCSGSGTYNVGDTVTISVSLTTYDDDGHLWVFSRWSDGNTNHTRTVTASLDKTYTAIFVTLLEYTVILCAGNERFSNGDYCVILYKDPLLPNTFVTIYNWDMYSGASAIIIRRVFTTLLYHNTFIITPNISGLYTVSITKKASHDPISYTIENGSYIFNFDLDYNDIPYILIEKT